MATATHTVFRMSPFTSISREQVRKARIKNDVYRTGYRKRNDGPMRNPLTGAVNFSQFMHVHFSNERDYGVCTIGTREPDKILVSPPDSVIRVELTWFDAVYQLIILYITGQGVVENKEVITEREENKKRK